jgi:hypothetical protein
MTLLERFGCVRRFNASALTVMMSVGAVLVCGAATGAEDTSVAADPAVWGGEAVTSCGAPVPDAVDGAAAIVEGDAGAEFGCEAGTAFERSAGAEDEAGADAVFVALDCPAER